MKFRLHPDAALEHEQQVAYYEAQAPGLGRRYHQAFLSLAKQACRNPRQFKAAYGKGVRRAYLQGFPLSIVFREHAEEIQIIAVAHHRRRPRYWVSRD